MSNDSHSFPKHVAIVMDGNGRWAKKRFLPRISGHHAGAKAVKKAIQFAIQHNISVLTLFALSTENWSSRPQNELECLLELFFNSLREHTNELHQNNVRLRVIGNLAPLSKNLLQQITAAEKQTQANTGLNLVIAINYSGRWDIVQAAKQIAEHVAEKKFLSADIDEKLFQRYLALYDLPEPDLLIRTSGEQRISNFMLWQFAYTELFFSQVLWPDFAEETFMQALEFYKTRERRFGAIQTDVCVR